MVSSSSFSFLRRFFTALFVLSSFASLSPVARAQARDTATRDSGLNVFGGFNWTYTDYRAPGNFGPPTSDFGGTGGVDFSQFMPHTRFVTPSVQIRGSFALGSEVGERTVTAGIKLGTTVFQRYHPYADFTVGEGIITFNHPETEANGDLYTRDSSFIYNYGGGVTYDIRRYWSVMAEYQRQYWNLGGHPPNRFYPDQATVGVVYHIHFKPYKTY